MPRYALIDAPSILGLKPEGVEELPGALRRAGLRQRLDAEDAGAVETLNSRYSGVRDPTTGMLNGEAIRDFSIRLAGTVGALSGPGACPVVLGGDCSIVLGPLLALRRRGRYGLVFIDGHADFYDPRTSATGEAADMDLALAAGRGPAIIADLEGRRPLVRDEDVILLGYRDAADAAREGSPDVRETAIHAFDVARVRQLGAAEAARAGVASISPDLEGLWVHLDADVLNDEIMPAVDYRLPGGLSLAELSAVLKVLVASGRVVGITIAIFNPRLDPSGTIAGRFVDALVEGLMPAEGEGSQNP